MGFSLHNFGPRKFRESPNLASANNNPEVLKAKILREVEAGRVEGPFKQSPFPNIQVSPLGLVPKKTPNEFRLIHHLSYPAKYSINNGIPHELCTVRYQARDQAILHICNMGQGALMAKTDIESAFKLIPIQQTDHELLGFKVEALYYFDKTLPMGASISCNLFESFSTALHWVAEHRLAIRACVHVLDDFLFISPNNANLCSEYLGRFLDFCKEIGVPIKKEKTRGPSPVMTFLGIELDSILCQARLPIEKVNKTSGIHYILSCHVRKCLFRTCNP